MKDSVIEQVVKTWQVHNEINLFLIEQIPAAGFAAVPLNSRGRTVARQLGHMNEVRLGWLHFQNTGKRPKRGDAKREPTRAELLKAFRESGKSVETFLAERLDAGTRIRMFGGNVVRWIGYLISHESSHRGQIALALKQQGMKLPEKVAPQGLWGKWFFGGK